MIRTDFVVTQDTPGFASISWTATDATKANWLYVDGKPVASNLVESTAARSISVPWESDDTHHIELHEEDLNSDISCTVPVQNSLPYLSWSNVFSAVRYDVINNLKMIGSFPQDLDSDTFYFLCPSRLTAGWNTLEIRSENAYGSQSTGTIWDYFVWTILPEVSDVTVAGSGGVFDLTVTA
jgi:hypothetical protein